MTARCCGTRVAGGIYASCGLSPDGRPIEDFLYDPPVELPRALAVAPQGVAMLPRDGIVHLVDWVGSKFYPNVADFVQEVKALGMSRRLPSSFDFSVIRPGAKHILIHQRAIIAHPQMYRARVKGIMQEGAHRCPKQIEKHQLGDPSEMCAGIWWEDIEGGIPKPESQREVVRRMPWGQYYGAKRPENARPEYVPGFFAAFPIMTIEVVRDTDGDKHEAAIEKAKNAGVSVELVDE